MPISGQSGISVSAVVPTYNRAHLVGRALESILSQTYPAEEIVVVDDGSTDGTEGVVRGFGERVRYVRQENSGGARARNRGVNESRSEWVGFLDSDDMWTPTHLQQIADTIRQTDGRAVFYYDDMTLPEPGEKTWWAECGFQVEGPFVMVPDATEWVMREYQPMMLQTTVCRRAAFLAEGGLWEELRNAHDTHFFLKIGISNPACAVQNIGARQTSDATGASRLTSEALEGRRYVNKTLAFGDILRSKPALSPGHQACLRGRIADAYWRLGRIALSERRFGGMFSALVRALMADPATMARLIGHAFVTREGEYGDAPERQRRSPPNHRGS